MQAIRIHQTGDPEVMQLETVTTPQPEANEVLVKIAAIGVNFIDIYQRTGAYPIDLPFTPGLEAAGVVEAIGSDVTDFKPGDPVAYATVPASYAQYVVVPVAKLVPVPASLDLKQAAAGMLQGMTAHYLTHSTYPLQAGDTLIVLGSPERLVDLREGGGVPASGQSVR